MTYEDLAESAKSEQQRADAQAMVGREVAWAHDRMGFERMRVEAATTTGLVRLEGFPGEFAPHLFRVIPS